MGRRNPTLFEEALSAFMDILVMVPVWVGPVIAIPSRAELTSHA